MGSSFNLRLQVCTELWARGFPLSFEVFCKTDSARNHEITTSGWFTSWLTHKWPIHHGGKKRGIVLVLLHFVKSSKHISQRWHSFFHCSFLLLQWAMSDFPRNCDCVLFFIQFFFKFTSIYLQNFLFFLEARSDEEDLPATAGRARKKRILCFWKFCFSLVRAWFYYSACKLL